MTELMKQYEAEMDEVSTWTWHNKEFVTDDVLDWAWEKIQELQAENAQLTEQTVEKFQEIIRNQCDEISALKDQLRWRPVSEKPEKDGWYLCKVQYVDNAIGEETVHFDGEHFVFSSVVKWLPIPPTPEGE
jgi:hypothetical protein